ncbi:NAD-dependent epimerase/dehydratase family protein [Lysinibacillus odysseyi]|uniref:UDP-glucose 4-epimerase n=1 Tax=Lysinibacillus odysseyi 34hs-1 = NBRC 100172 TaxID=1220589 RepID=A0A0A3IN14_9BACI|nr:NAD-dependent epimerase/dehydratase family protein [Lysinibacillus odysseyi]KGR86141.1 NAD-dependent dehydratase [Lysinibacillus odysseyi 34hs-1 = NBRC 100172]
MKRILVLGGTRFFGRKLVEQLLEEGHQVTIVTRGKMANPFGEHVQHITVDRGDKVAFAKAMEGQTYDIVYDNICYSPNDAKAFCDIFNGKIGKLVFTSTLSTYEANGKAKTEKDFDPYTYEIVMGETNDFTYGEGKRQAEAVFFKYAEFPVVAVRFPIVLGIDDYTERLHFHVERVAAEKPIGFVNMDAEMSFITAEEAGRFLKWAGLSDAQGPYNATAAGKISLKELMDLIEKATGKRAKIALVGNDEIRSPYAIPASWYMTTEKAEGEGFVFSRLNDWLPKLIEQLAKQYS